MPKPDSLFPAAGAFSVPAVEKQPRLLAELNRLTIHHAARCPGYARMLEALGWSARPVQSLAEVPFVPAQVFKRTRLASVPETEIVRTLRSSGTTGQTPSRIALDRTTADLQARALGHLMREFAGPQRRPMVIIDEPVRVSADGFTARGAGQLGFAPLGRDHFHLLQADGTPDVDGLRAWLAAHPTEPVTFVGMTAPAWQHLLTGPVAAAGLRCAQPALLIHGGGWKKLADRQVGSEAFKAAARVLNIAVTRDYYGMVEQTGSIHVEDDDGHLLTPFSGDVLVRHPRTFAPLPAGEPGLLQVFSALPHSYPGHSILTEDLGRIISTAGCPGGRHGTRFVVLGRLPASELRGCSDAAASTP